MPGYNHDAFMQVIKSIQTRAGVTGLADFKQGEDTYPVVELEYKPYKAYGEHHTARYKIKDKIHSLEPKDQVTLLKGLLHHAKEVWEPKLIKCGAYILDLIEICEEAIGRRRINSFYAEICQCDLIKLKEDLEYLAETARNLDYKIALAKHEEYLDAEPDRQETPETFKGGRAKQETIMAFKYSRTKYGFLNSVLFVYANGSKEPTVLFKRRKLAAGKYLGSGTTCDVKTIDKMSNTKPYAIKQVKPRNIAAGSKYTPEKAKEIARNMIVREYEFLRALAPETAICPVNEAVKCTNASTGDESYYLILPKAQEDLYCLLFEKKHFDETKAIVAFADTAQLIKNMHAQNIAHHDIKPANVLIMDDGSIRLCDFGMAYHIKGDENKEVSPPGGTEQYYYNSEQKKLSSKDDTIDKPRLPAKHWDIFAFLVILIDAYLRNYIKSIELPNIFNELSDVDNGSCGELFKNLDVLSLRDEKYYQLVNTHLTTYFKANRKLWRSGNDLTMEKVIAAMDKAGVRNTAGIKNTEVQSQVPAPASLLVSQQPSYKPLLGVIESNGGAEINLDASEKTCCWCPCRFFVCDKVNYDSEEYDLHRPFIS